MELHEEIKRARLDMDLSQQRLAEIAGIQRSQLASLEAGGNVTLNTLRKVIAVLPNLQEFTIGYVKMKPEQLPIPPFDYEAFAEAMGRITEIFRNFQAEVERYKEIPAPPPLDELSRRGQEVANALRENRLKMEEDLEKRRR